MKPCIGNKPHRFQPRYHAKKIKDFNSTELRALRKNYTAKEVRKLYILLQHKYDICIRCGKIVKYEISLL